MSLFSFYKQSPAQPLVSDDQKVINKRFRRLQWSSFIAITLGYSLYYVCRTSLNVVKKPIMDAGILDASQLGVISSALLFTYAIGKFINGFLADYSNIRKFMKFFDIVGGRTNSGHDLWRIFYCKETDDLTKLPQQTGLQRAYVKMLQEGTPTGVGIGIFFLKDGKIL